MAYDSYCTYARSQPIGNHHRDHHDTEHGFRPKDDDDLFRRLILEINQAGLSFDTILKKKEAIYKAYPSVAVVAQYTNRDITRLMNNPSIIRNKLKICAAIHNAKVIKKLQKSHGSFAQWLNSYHPQSKEEWITLFKKTFKFTGPEIVNEFLMSTTYLPGAHDLSCPIFKQDKRI